MSKLLEGFLRTSFPGAQPGRTGALHENEPGREVLDVCRLAPEVASFFARGSDLRRASACGDGGGLEDVGEGRWTLGL